MTEIFLPFPAFSEGEEGGGESPFFVEIGLVVEVADSVLHASLEDPHGFLRASDGSVQIMQEHPSNLLHIVTVLGKIVYMRC